MGWGIARSSGSAAVSLGITDQAQLSFDKWELCYCSLHLETFSHSLFVFSYVYTSFSVFDQLISNGVRENALDHRK